MDGNILILANFGLDPCLAASLLIEKINQVQSIIHCPYIDSKKIAYGEIDYYADGELEIYGNENKVFTCFVNEIDVCDAFESIGYCMQVIYVVGFGHNMNRFVSELIEESQAVQFIPEGFCTLRVFGWVEKFLEKDETGYASLRLVTSLIANEEFYNFPNYIFDKRMIKAAQKLDDLHYNLIYTGYDYFENYTADPNNLGLLYRNFFSYLVHAENPFIAKIMAISKEMRKETDRIRKKIPANYRGTVILKTGPKKFFRTEILLEMINIKKHAFCAIEYNNRKGRKAVVAMDYDNNVYVQNGPLTLEEKERVYLN